MFQLNLLSTIGLMVVLGYLVSKVVQQFGIPQVVGYILSGIILGSSVLNIVPIELTNELGFATEIALGLIGFQMGAHLHWKELKALGRSISLIVLFEAVGASLLVGVGVYMITQSMILALLLGGLAAATAPAATVEVLTEYEAKGPLTTVLLAVIGLDDALALLLFSIGIAISESLLLGMGNLSIQSLVLLPVQEIGGALVVGLAIGIPLQVLLNRLTRKHAVCAFIVGMILFVAGLAELLGISLILTLMTMGFVVANFKTDNSEYAHCVVERVGPLAYILFFSLAGAHLQLHKLPEIGVLGLSYLLLRGIGKIGGASLGGKIGKAPVAVQKYLGFGLLSQAGVVIGLALTVTAKFEQYGGDGQLLAQTIVGVITSAILVLELLGPILVKVAIVKAGEAKASARQQ